MAISQLLRIFKGRQTDTYYHPSVYDDLEVVCSIWEVPGAVEEEGKYDELPDEKERSFLPISLLR